MRTRAISSVVEHYLDMVGVAGSNPASRTISPSTTNFDMSGQTVGANKETAQLDPMFLQHARRLLRHKIDSSS